MKVNIQNSVSIFFVSFFAFFFTQLYHCDQAAICGTLSKTALSIKTHHLVILKS